jgi:hypothetical protein
VFQRYLSYWVLSRTNDKAVAGGFDNCSRDDMKVVHAENSLDLSEESSQKPEVSSGHPKRLAMTSGTSCSLGRTTPAGVHRFSSSS